MKNFFPLLLLGVILSQGVVAQERAGDEVEQKESRKSDIRKYSSLMFLEEDMELIEKAERSRQTNVPIEILLPDIFSAPVEQTQPPAGIRPSRSTQEQEPAQPKRNFVYDEPVTINPADTPIHYLRSVLYLSPQDWTVWFNSKKISSLDDTYEIEDELYGRIRIITVEPRRVIAVWDDFPTDMISSDYQQFAVSLADELYADDDAQIIYDAVKNRLVFILLPNQAIVPYLLRVAEGENNARLMLFEAVEQVSETEIAEGKTTQAPPQNVALDKVQPAKRAGTGTLGETDQHKKHMENYMKQLDLLQGILQQAE